MRARTLLLWIAVGLVGLVLAAGVSYAATQLSSQRIGLSAEPPSAGEELAPPERTGAPRTTTAPTTTPQAQARQNGHGARTTTDRSEQPREGGGDLDD
jgi:hypothetical protein